MIFAYTIIGECMKEEFKKFVQKHPNLIDYVNNKKMTWQQFYEMYDLYGENNSIWNNFENNNSSKETSSIGLITAIKEFLGLFKGIDLNTVQKTLTSLDKAIEAFKGFNNNENVSNNYEERPKYKYFED